MLRKTTPPNVRFESENYLKRNDDASLCCSARRRLAVIQLANSFSAAGGHAHRKLYAYGGGRVGGVSHNHQFVRDDAFPRWHGWHAFRRGIATNLHQLGVAEKDIQAIPRHSNIGITMNIYVKSVAESR